MEDGIVGGALVSIAVGAVSAYVTYLLTHRGDLKIAAIEARLEQQRGDLAAYEMLVKDWHKFLDIQLAYPELCLEVHDGDVQFGSGTVESRRRYAAYDLLFSIFERAYALREAFQQNHRLQQLDDWSNWDAWVTEYFRKPSIQEHYKRWRWRYLGAGADVWLEDKLRATDNSPS